MQPKRGERGKGGGACTGSHLAGRPGWGRAQARGRRRQPVQTACAWVTRRSGAAKTPTARTRSAWGTSEQFPRPRTAAAGLVQREQSRRGGDALVASCQEKHSAPHRGAQPQVNATNPSRGTHAGAQRASAQRHTLRWGHGAARGAWAVRQRHQRYRGLGTHGACGHRRLVRPPQGRRRLPALHGAGQSTRRASFTKAHLPNARPPQHTGLTHATTGTTSRPCIENTHASPRPPAPARARPRPPGHSGTPAHAA